LISWGRILAVHFRLAFGRTGIAMLDLIYLALGVAVLGVFGLYALGLKRI